MQQQYTYTAPHPPLTKGPVNQTLANWMYWITLWFMVITVAIGLNWDRSWHSKHVFDTFYSPPHLFIYGTTIFTILLVALITFTPGLRRAFGPGFRVFFLPFEVPGSLFIVGAGLATLGIAGLLDDFWHTSFGLDETGWSTPHAMLGWAWFITVLGFISCRIALHRSHTLNWFTSIILGVLLVTFSTTPFLGPFHGNFTPALVQAISHFPVLLAQAPARHTFRIYLDWNLTRTNSLFIAIAALWCGSVLAMLRTFDKRNWVFLIVSFITTFANLGERSTAQFLLQTKTPPLASWLPVPLFFVALSFIILIQLKLPERWAWGITGGILGFLLFIVWGLTPLAALFAFLAIPSIMLGASIGKRIMDIVTNPVRESAWALVLLMGLSLPAATGVIDLILRRLTP